MVNSSLGVYPSVECLVAFSVSLLNSFIINLSDYGPLVSKQEFRLAFSIRVFYRAADIDNKCSFHSK